MATATAQDIEGTKRVRDTLDFTLKPVLDGFVEANMKGKHGLRWLHFASRSTGQGPNDPLDTYGLCKTVLDNWNEVFGPRFERKDVHRARGRFSTVFEARNAVAHLGVPLSDPEALNYLNAMVELGRLLKAPTPILDKLKAAYADQRSTGIRQGNLDPATPEEPAPAAPAQASMPLDAFEAAGGKGLRPWRDVAWPHPDVLENRFREAEFAADLFAVDSGNVESTSDYAVPQNFFKITFLTEGLRRILTSSLRRLAGDGGDPVIGLQTSFGGGKTHTMLAVYHLARTEDLDTLAGVPAIAANLGLKAWRRPQVAVFVGTAKGTEGSLVLKDGPRAQTLWGYIGWRLAGQAGFDLMARADATYTNPGSELLVELFRLSGPAAILLDELVAFARQLPDDRFEAFLSFIQSLTEAAKMVRGILVIGSLPESHAEAGGPKGVDALLRLEKVFGRVQSSWLPASGDETYEIIRRRLFQPLDAEAEKARDETVKAFHDLYRKNAAEFPPEAKEARYGELLRLSYPIHPELFDRLSKDWASLAKFQRTRGVLRFMANVVGVLWQMEARSPLITAARVPIANERVRANILEPLDGGFAAVVDKEVDGESSLPARMETNPSRRITQAKAATRAARAVFLCSAPLVGQPNAGLTGQGLKLACAEPGDQLAIFGDALRELSERATYLYEQGGRYWFSTQPTLNRLAEDRGRAFEAYRVDEEIARILKEDAGHKGSGFARIHAAPDDPTAIDEAEAPSLVILSPATPHVGKGVTASAATQAVEDALTRCRSSQRRFRNSLFFVAADEGQLEQAREVMRRAMAWDEIAADERLHRQLPSGQIDDARVKAKSNRTAAVRAVRAAWTRIFYALKPDQALTGVAFQLEPLALSGRDAEPLPRAVYDKARGDGAIVEKLGAGRLWDVLKDLWPADTPHLAVSELWAWFGSFVYMPKLRDRVVLDTAIREAVSGLAPHFGYADAVDATSGEYRGLLWAKAPPDLLPATAVLVRADVARKGTEPAIGEGQPQGPMGGGSQTDGGAGPGGLGERPGQPIDGNAPAAQKRLRRFYGSVEIDPSARPMKAFEAILDAVVLQLQTAPGTRVKLTLEVEAEAADGFRDDDVGVVRDNAKQLRFRAESTGFE